MLACPTPSDSVKSNRNLHCQNYNACLSDAAQAGWQSFSCASCPLRTRDEAPRSETYLGRRGTMMDMS